jgi:hypothetical protein
VKQTVYIFEIILVFSKTEKQNKTFSDIVIGTLVSGGFDLLGNAKAKRTILFLTFYFLHIHRLKS